MNSKLNEFFRAERKRVFEPDAFFAGRVMARLREQPVRDGGIWESVFVATRPVFAVALVLLVAFVTLHVFVPIQPRRGPIEAYLAPEQTPSEQFLFTGEAASTETLEQLIMLEEGR